MCLSDAIYDCQAEAHTGVVGVFAFRATLKRLGKGGNLLRGKAPPGVLDRELHVLGVNAGCDPYGAVLRQVVDDGVVYQVRRHLEQERL